MALIYKNGDLFKATENLLAHGVNCKGAFASGVAAGMAIYYPEAKKLYFEKHNTQGWLLGDVQFVKISNKWIANCATQYNYLPRGICHANYEAIEKAMKNVKNFAQSNNLSIAIPKIGSGLAGGDWNIIEDILQKIFDDYDITVYYL